MIASDSDQCRLYQARLKFERDAQAQAIQDGFAKGFDIGFAKGLEIGFAKGLEIGLAKGEKIGMIKLLRELLGKHSSPDGELESLSIEQLAPIEQDLRRQLRERG